MVISRDFINNRKEAFIFHFILFLLFFFNSKHIGLPCGSVGKESSCNAGDPGSIPGSGRSAKEEIGYLLQYSWTSLVA